MMACGVRFAAILAAGLLADRSQLTVAIHKDDVTPKTEVAD
jgi:hypothetical protein